MVLELTMGVASGGAVGEGLGSAVARRAVAGVTALGAASVGPDVGVAARPSATTVALRVTVGCTATAAIDVPVGVTTGWTGRAASAAAGR